MNGITGISSTPVQQGIDAKSRIAPSVKPEVQRVAANPFFPDGFVVPPEVNTEEAETIPEAVDPAAYEAKRQVFENNLPGTQQEASQKIGTVLNTLA